MKCTWPQILRSDSKYATLACELFSPQLGLNIFKCNFHKDDVKQFLHRQHTPFWFDVLAAWAEFNYVNELTEDCIIWYNSNLKVAGEVILWPESVEAGLWSLQQIEKDKPFQELVQDFKLSTMQLNVLLAYRNRATRSKKTVCYEEVIAKKHLSQYVYNNLSMRGSGNILPINRWEEDFGETLSPLDVQECYMAIYAVTNSMKLRSFQYRLLNRGLVLNTHLYRWKMRDSPMCSFCATQREDYQHFFCECINVTTLWTRLIEWANSVCDKKMDTEFDAKKVVTNSVGRGKKAAINVICLIFKCYLYKERCLGNALSFSSLKSEILMYRNIEKYNATLTNSMEKHDAKWKEWSF